MRNNTQQKQMIIAHILAGAVWTPESGLYRNTFKALMRLPRVDLTGLQLIVQDKVAASRRPQTTK
jgi:hypothetical protein